MEAVKLSRTLYEARRFCKKAEEALAKLERDTMASISGSKETAACHRASLDLTRSLAELRKP